MPIRIILSKDGPLRLSLQRLTLARFDAVRGRPHQQIKDRLSFQRFLGLGLDGTVPDATTVWLFRERLVKAKAIDRLFAHFDAVLKDRDGRTDHRRDGGAGAEAAQHRSREGGDPARPRARGLDAGQGAAEGSRCTLVDQIQQGQGAGRRRPRAAKPVDLAIPMFGYKNHIGIDKAHGLIRTWRASAANAHDGARLPDLVSKGNTGLGRLGGHGLSFQEERGIPGRRHVQEPYPPAAQTGAVAVGADRQGEVARGI